MPVSHQFELAKLSFIENYDLLINPYRTWGTNSRPFPEKMRWVTHYEPGRYDFAILHIDQQCMGERIGKGLLYRQVNELITDIPKIVINHMTPFQDNYTQEETIKAVKEMVGNNFMIVNSETAREQWGFGHTVIHGMSIDEWDSKEKEPRVTCFLSQAGMEKAYKRENLRNTINILNEWGYKFYWIGLDVKFGSWKEYKNWLSRSLIYLNMTYQSPMPRARTEAMLSGACIVTTGHQDADKYIKDGENGFLISGDPEEAASLIAKLLTTDSEKALEIGKKGREFARKTFNFENFEKQWLDVLKLAGIEK